MRDDGSEEGEWRDMDQAAWEQVVTAATRAPSIHNTQPWLFTATAEQLDVFTDPTRTLPVLDPSGRQRIMSCGIAVEFAVVALRAAGVAADVDLLPDPHDEDHLATLLLTGPHDPTDVDRALGAAIEQRHTERAPFQPRAVPDEVVDRLQREAGSFGVWVKPITESEEEVATVFLISRAEELEQGEPAYRAELERWLRSDPGAPDGVPLTAVPSEDPATRASDWLIRDFVVGSRGEERRVTDPDAPPPPVERPAVLLMGTMNDDRRAWLEAGRALGRVLLQVTVAGLASSPLTQALDWPATRHQLTGQLSLVGHPQMLLRLGYPVATGGTPSGRRPVGEVLRRG
jgi:nitroreductase